MATNHESILWMVGVSKYPRLGKVTHRVYIFRTRVAATKFAKKERDKPVRSGTVVVTNPKRAVWGPDN